MKTLMSLALFMSCASAFAADKVICATESADYSFKAVSTAQIVINSLITAERTATAVSAPSVAVYKSGENMEATICVTITKP